MQPKLSDLELMSRQAGVILRHGYIKRPGFGANHRIERKGAIDLVTEIDKQSEAFLLGEIRRRFPDHRIEAEESGELSGDDCCVWYVDPLDGTINYAHGVPIFSVSIGLAREGVLQLGAVYDPMHDECFSAERGRGAWLNGQPIRCSKTKELIESLLVTGFSYDIHSNPQNNLDQYVLFSLRARGVRRIGSAAIDLCYVASGRFDGFWELSLGPWDLAAGALIAEEAGAVVTDLKGDADYLQPPCPVLAANAHLHPKMLKLLQEMS